MFKKLDVEQITYKQWESIDRTDLVTHTDTVYDFSGETHRQTPNLKTTPVHSFTTDCTLLPYKRKLKTR